MGIIDEAVTLTIAAIGARVMLLAQARVIWHGWMLIRRPGWPTNPANIVVPYSRGIAIAMALLALSIVIWLALRDPLVRY